MNDLNYKIKLAGIPMEISCIHSSVKELCRDYLTEEEPLFSVTTDQGLIDAERKLSEEENRRCGIDVSWSDPYLETLAVYRGIAERLPAYDAMLFHGSAIWADGRAYIFTARSGTGKSTHTRLWRKLFEDKVFMINDDKPLLRFIGEGADKQPLAFGTPWDGKHRLSANTCAPIGGLCLLERCGENSIERISGAESFPKLLTQTYMPEDTETAAATVQLVSALSAAVPCWRLKCNMEDRAAVISYEAMTGIYG